MLGACTGRFVVHCTCFASVGCVLYVHFMNMQSFGDTPVVNYVINQSIRASLLDQAFAFHVTSVNGSTVVAATGAPVNPAAWFKASVAIGPLYGMYAALESMGFAFTHPLSPIYPPSLQAPPPFASPVVHHFAWPIRSWHYHTEHPLDLQEVLNGFDAGSVASLTSGGSSSPSPPTKSAAWDTSSMTPPPQLHGGGVRGQKAGLDAASMHARRSALAGAVGTLQDTARAVAAGRGAGTREAPPPPPTTGGAPTGAYNQTWESMLPEVDSYFEWLVANQQNRLEFILLYYQGWADFATGPVRQQRLAHIVGMAHQWGLLLGIDNAIALIQQHSWYMTSSNGTLAQQQGAIAGHLDWFMSLGYDYLSTESGTTEFSHPNDVQMLAWMNFTAEHMNSTWNSRTYIKCHCSSDQTCANYVDPRTGQPLNFNFLPMYADSRVGIMPHTVQVYDIVADPAPTYGNSNFTYMADFLLYMAEVNKANQAPGTFEREIVFHGETTYWVNYDISTCHPLRAAACTLAHKLFFHRCSSVPASVRPATVGGLRIPGAAGTGPAGEHSRHQQLRVGMGIWVLAGKRGGCTGSWSQCGAVSARGWGLHRCPAGTQPAVAGHPAECRSRSVRHASLPLCLSNGSA